MCKRELYKRIKIGKQRRIGRNTTSVKQEVVIFNKNSFSYLPVLFKRPTNGNYSHYSYKGLEQSKFKYSYHK